MFNPNPLISAHSLLNTEFLQIVLERGTIVFDTNTILDTYEWDEADTNALFKALRGPIFDRLWMTHQIAHEYYKNRTVRTTKRINLIKRAEESLNGDIDKLKNKVLQPSWDTGALAKGDDGGFGAIHENLEQWRRPILQELQTKRELLSDRLKIETDDIYKRVLDIFKDRVGQPLSRIKTFETIKMGELRYSLRIPPGYEDQKKEGVWERFGDLLIWEQMIEHAQREDVQGVLFITSDSKPDWRNPEQTGQPHPLLVDEFLERTGKPFWLCSFPDFLREALRAAILAPIQQPIIGRLWRDVLSSEIRRLKALLNMVEEDLTRAMESTARLKQYHQYLQDKYMEFDQWESPHPNHDYVQLMRAHERMTEAMQHESGVRSTYVVIQRELERVTAQFAGQPPMPAP